MDYLYYFIWGLGTGVTLTILVPTTIKYYLEWKDEREHQHWVYQLFDSQITSCQKRITILEVMHKMDRQHESKVKHGKKGAGDIR